MKLDARFVDTAEKGEGCGQDIFPLRLCEWTFEFHSKTITRYQ